MFTFLTRVLNSLGVEVGERIARQQDSNIKAKTILCSRYLEDVLVSVNQVTI